MQHSLRGARASLHALHFGLPLSGRSLVSQRAAESAPRAARLTQPSFDAETLKPLLPYIKPPSAASTNTEEIPFELLLRGAGVLLALYVLCATTDESVRILPSLEPGTSPEEPADEEEIGWMIEIEVGE